MFALPKGTIVKIGGLPFELLEDVLTSASEEGYKFALELSHCNSRDPSRPSEATSPETAMTSNSSP